MSKIPKPNFTNDKLGGIGKIVQADETMLNYKYKSHRGRSLSNKTDALSIVEFKEEITRVFATVIPDRKATTILPIICEQVASGSIVHTDEAPTYKKLSKLSYLHLSVRHKLNFVDKNTGVHTQAVESFNNIIKREVKSRMGVKTEKGNCF